jgi:hypothetical protein
MDDDNERVIFMYTTHPSVVEAERIGRELLERRLCACVNILPGMVSLYWWQGAIERGEEAVMIIKTRDFGDADRGRRYRLREVAFGGDAAASSVLKRNEFELNRHFALRSSYLRCFTLADR